MRANKPLRHGMEEDRRCWLERLSILRRSPKTISTYGTALNHLLRFAATHRITRSANIQTADLTAWRHRLHVSGCKPATVDLFLRAAKGWFRWLTETGRVFIDPAAEVESPRIPRTCGRFASEDEMRRLLDGIRGQDALALRDRALLETAYSTAARRSELADLDVSSVDLGNRVLRIRGKGDRERIVPLTNEAVTALDRYLSGARSRLAVGPGERALFLSRGGGGRLSAFAVARIIKRRGADTGLDLTPHGIRRAVATHLVRRGAPIYQVKELLGHQSFRHLGRYTLLQTANVIHLLRRSRLNR